MKVLALGFAALILAVVMFVVGANQHRTNGWPFDRGYFSWSFGQPAFTGIRNTGDAQKKTEIPQWIEKLQKGGYILYFRHANRDKWAEVAAFDVYALAEKVEDPTQTSYKKAVCLSDQGIEEAKMIGKIFQLARIPTGVVVSSPSCRAKQTATNAFGKIDIVDNSVLSHGLLSKKAFSSYVDQLRTLLQNVEIKPGTNTVFTGHSATLERNEMLQIGGEILSLDETGFYVIQRTSGNQLSVVYSIKSISDLAMSAVDLPLK